MHLSRIKNIGLIKYLGNNRFLAFPPALRMPINRKSSDKEAENEKTA